MDVDGDARIVGGDVSRDRHFGRRSVATVGDLDLGTGDVPLRSTGDVQSKVLDSEEVLTRKE